MVMTETISIAVFVDPKFILLIWLRYKSARVVVKTFEFQKNRRPGGGVSAIIVQAIYIDYISLCVYLRGVLSKLPLILLLLTINGQ